MTTRERLDIISGILNDLEAINKDLKDDLQHLYNLAHGLDVRRGFDSDHPTVLEIHEKLKKFEDKHGIENGVFGKKAERVAVDIECYGSPKHDPKSLQEHIDTLMKGGYLVTGPEPVLKHKSVTDTFMMEFCNKVCMIMDSSDLPGTLSLSQYGNFCRLGWIRDAEPEQTTSFEVRFPQRRWQGHLYISQQKAVGFRKRLVARKGTPEQLVDYLKDYLVKSSKDMV